MASKRSAEGLEAQELEARKTGLLRSVLKLSQQEALLIDLDGLEGLLEEKERLIVSLRRIDEQLAVFGDAEERELEREEQGRLLAGILENERTVEQRMESERQRLGQELRELERETRVRTYLERPGARHRRVDLKR